MKRDTLNFIKNAASVTAFLIMLVTCVSCGNNNEIEKKPNSLNENSTKTACVMTTSSRTTPAPTGEDKNINKNDGNWLTPNPSFSAEITDETVRPSLLGPTPTPVVSAMIKPSQHVHNYSNSVVKATCTSGGYTIYTCSCGDVYTANKTNKLGHKYGAWETVTPATEESTGTQKRICSRCKEKETQSIPKLPSKYDVLATPDNAELLEERLLYYINLYREEEGHSAAEQLSDLYADYARIRSQQIVINFEHDETDIKTAATALKFGTYYPEREETRLDLETFEIIYTGNMIPAHYYPYGMEAIGSVYGDTIDDIAKRAADGFRESKSHWAYVGAVGEGYEVMNYITIGVTVPHCGRAYICIIMDDNDACI